MASALLAGAGASQAAAPTVGSQLYAFGANQGGELGTSTNSGTSNANPTPTQVMLPGATGPVTQVVAGGNFSLAATSTGQLYAFGGNTYGQLGTTTNVATGTANPTPTLVGMPEATGPVTAIAAGANFSLAATSTGQLYGFGGNYFGELGTTTNNGTPNAANPTPTLVTLPGASGPVTQIAAGGNHSLVLTSTDQLYTFGYNYYGQLGNPVSVGTSKPTPPTLVGLPGATGPVTEIAAGVSHSLVLTSTGQLYSFGENLFGQLGSSTTSGTEAPTSKPTLVSLPGASGPVAQIAAGANHSLAATTTGQLYTFGRNRVGELGSTTNNGTDTPSPTPTLVALPGAIGPVIRLAAGLNHSVAATSTGQLYAFGYNAAGQLGNPINSGTSAANPTPARVGLPAGTTIDAVARGEAADHTLVLVSEPAATGPGIRSSPTPSLSATSQPPALTAAGMTHKRFRVAKRSTAISARKAPLGTSFRFVLSTAAKVQIAITRSGPGLRRGHLCAVPTARLRRAHAKRCTRTLTVAVLTRTNMPPGADQIAFSGRIGHRALTPHSYRAALSASNSAGRSTPLTLSFTIVR